MEWRTDDVNGCEVTGGAWEGGQVWKRGDRWVANAYVGLYVCRWIELQSEILAKRTVEGWINEHTVGVTW